MNGATRNSSLLTRELISILSKKKGLDTMKKCISIMLTLILMVSCICIPASAVDSTLDEGETAVARATGRFSMDVSAKSTRKASTSFPLEAGEVVTIKASYSPFSANVDFGLIAPNGRFYYVTVTDGSVDEAVTITERGNYTFAVRNNSAYPISVSGYVNY